MFTGKTGLTLSEKFIPLIGDTGKTGAPSSLLDLGKAVKAFSKYGDPVHAQVAYMLNGDSTQGLHNDIFTENPNQVAEDIQAAVDRYGTFHPDSDNLTGYGLAALREGENKKEAAAEKKEAPENTLRDLWMYYGRTAGHGHSDTLNIGIHGYGADLTPELGYPETADNAPHRRQWLNNTIAHNTVVVDRSRQNNIIVADPRQILCTLKTGSLSSWWTSALPNRILLHRNTEGPRQWFGWMRRIPIMWIFSG